MKQKGRETCRPTPFSDYGTNPVPVSLKRQPSIPHGFVLARDFENLAETLATFVTLASIQPALTRLARA